MSDGLSILMLAYNESGNIARAIREVVMATVWADLGAYEIIVVDDGSTDGDYFSGSTTHQRAFRAATACPVGQIKVHRYTPNMGLRYAYEYGLKYARYERVVWLPSDGEISPLSLVDIFRAIGTADLVAPYHGTPWLRPWFRRALTWISTTEMNLLFGHRLNYFQGPTVLPTAVARSIIRTEPGFFCMAEQLLTLLELGYTYVEVPLIHRERTYGVSKAVSWARIWHAQMAVLRFWWTLKLRRKITGLRKLPEGVTA